MNIITENEIKPAVSAAHHGHMITGLAVATEFEDVEL